MWDASLELVRGGLPRWHARWWDEEAGVIQALARGRFLRRASDVVVRIRLDAQGQTRVDLRSTSRPPRWGGFANNARRIGVFTLELDRMLAIAPEPPPASSESARDGSGKAAARTELPSGGAAPDPSGSASERAADGAAALS